MSGASDEARPEAASREYPRFRARDALAGAVAGLGGMAAMVPVLLVAYVAGALEPRAFTALAEIVGLAPTVSVGGGSYGLLIGAIIFVGGGMTTLPLLFVSLAVFLPPADNIPLAGVTFATVIWTGFAIAFYTGQTGVALALYLALTLIAHWAYGYVLGALYPRFAPVPIYDV